MKVALIYCKWIKTDVDDKILPARVWWEDVVEQVPVLVGLPVLHHEGGDGAAPVLPAVQQEHQARPWDKF